MDGWERGGGASRSGCQELMSKVGLHCDSWRDDGHIELPISSFRHIDFIFFYLMVTLCVELTSTVYLYTLRFPSLFKDGRAFPA